MPGNQNKALIFVYNAESGKRNALLDSAHKLLNPQTYSCRLCDLTYGLFSEKTTWKKFRKNTDIETIFLHKDEYQKNFKSKFEALYQLPVILYQDNYDLSLLMSSTELNQIETVDILIDKIQSRI